MEERRRKLAAAELRFIRAQLEQLEMLLQAITSKTQALMAMHRSQRLKKAKPTHRTTKAQTKKQASAPAAAPEVRVRALAQTEGMSGQPFRHDRLQDPEGVISTSALEDVLAPPEMWVGTHGVGEPDVDRSRATPAD